MQEHQDLQNNDNFTVIPIKDLSRHDWLESRRCGIGGSDLGGILGMSSYATPIDVYLDKTRQTKTEEEENPFFWWGHKLELLVIEKYHEMYPGEKVTPAPGMLKSRKWPWMIANLDGVINIDREDGDFEIKTAGFPTDEWGRDGGNGDDIPEKYYCQVAHYLAVTGFLYAVLVAFFMASREIRRYFIKRDELVIKNIVAIEEKFWKENVLQNDPPTPTNSSDCNKLWAYDACTTATASDDIVKVAQELRSLKSEIKLMEGSDGKGGRKSELEAKIKNAMRDNQVLLGPDGRKICSWKTQTARRFQTKEFAIAHPGLDKEFRKESTSRVFRLGK